MGIYEKKKRDTKGGLVMNLWKACIIAVTSSYSAFAWDSVQELEADACCALTNAQYLTSEQYVASLRSCIISALRRRGHYKAKDRELRTAYGFVRNSGKIYCMECRGRISGRCNL